MQWYVTEQLDEEATTFKLLYKLHIIGDNKTAHYFFDSYIVGMTVVGQPTS